MSASPQSEDTRRDPVVSVIIRCRNEATSLQLIFDALSAQDLAHEIVVVDNESTDEGPELARRAGAAVVTIPTGDFTYGGSLNAGMAATRGEAVVVLSGHSIPVGTTFLRTAVAPLKDPNVAAVRLLRADKSWELARWTHRTPVPPDSPVEAVIVGGPIASGCVFRRSVWETIRFDEKVDSDEDKVWALAAVRLGYCIDNAPAVYSYTRAIKLIDALQRESRSAMGIYRASGALRPAAVLPTIRDICTGIAAALIAPSWRLVDRLTIPVRAKRGMRPGALWSDPERTSKGSVP